VSTVELERPVPHFAVLWLSCLAKLNAVNRDLLEYRTQRVGTYGDNMPESFSAFREKRPPRWMPV
jgi:hypothetical protein